MVRQCSKDTDGRAGWLLYHRTVFVQYAKLSKFGTAESAPPSLVNRVTALCHVIAVRSEATLAADQSRNGSNQLWDRRRKLSRLESTLTKVYENKGL